MRALSSDRRNCSHNPDPPTLAFLEKARVFPQNGTPKILGKGRKNAQKSKENRKTKKARKSKKARIGGSGNMSQIFKRIRHFSDKRGIGVGASGVAGRDATKLPFARNSLFASLLLRSYCSSSREPLLLRDLCSSLFLGPFSGAFKWGGRFFSVTRK